MKQTQPTIFNAKEARKITATVQKGIPQQDLDSFLIQIKQSSGRGENKVCWGCNRSHDFVVAGLRKLGFKVASVKNSTPLTEYQFEYDLTISW